MTLRLCFLLISFSLFLRAHAIELDWFTDYNGSSGGHTTCSFLNLPLSAATIGRGASSASGNNDATDLPVFTANSAIADRYTFAYTHVAWLMGMHKEYVGALFPFLDVGTLGFFSHVFSPGAIDQARDINEQPSSPSYLEYAVGTSFAHAFFRNKLSAGLAVSFVESRIEELTGRAACAAIDLRYAPIPALSSHLYATSLGSDISYSGATKEPLPAQIGLSLLIQPLPTSLTLKELFDFDIGIGARKIADEPVIAGISTEITTGRYFHLRAGYEYTKGTDPTVQGLSLGAGFFRGAISVDGGWRYYSKVFGPIWSATLRYQREEIIPPTAEDYYNRALKHYNQQRTFLCKLNAHRALQLDPNMWKAHALLSRLTADMLRNKRQEIALIYTGNAQGHFVAPVAEGTLGGFDRQATAIAALRAAFPLSLTIEAGNMLTAKLEPRRRSFAGAYLDYIGYDAVGCGSGELTFGTGKLSKEISPLQQFICSNIAVKPKAVIREKIVERDGYRFFIACYSAPTLLSSSKKAGLLPFNGKALSAGSKGCDLRILLVHDSWEQLRTRAADLTNFDIVICGNLKQRFPAPMQLGNTLVLSAGNRGEYVGRLMIRFDDKRKIISTENRLIPLQSAIAPDSTVARKLALLSHQVTPLQRDSTMHATSGTFAFVSDRTGREELYLKLPLKNAEFPLTRRIPDTCSASVHSFTASNVACKAQRNGCGRLLIMNLDGTDKRYVADSLAVFDASFSPDGSWLYYSAAQCSATETDIYRTRSAGGPSFPVVSWEKSSESCPIIADDGTQMLFRSNRDGTLQLYLTDTAMGSPLRITDSAAYHGSPTFSPNGRYIAYLSDRSNFGRKCDLWLFDHEGGVHRQITQHANIKSYCWLGDSRRIVLSGGSTIDKLTVVTIDEFRFSQLIASDSLKTWSERQPQRILSEGQEQIVYYREYAEGERHIYRVNSNGTDNVRIVKSKGNDWLAPLVNAMQ